MLPVSLKAGTTASSQNSACLRAIMLAIRFAKDSPGEGFCVFERHTRDSMIGEYVVQADTTEWPSDALGKGFLILWVPPVECWPAVSSEDLVTRPDGVPAP